MKTVNDICSAMRSCKPLNHDDLITVNASFAAMVRNSGVLGNKCKAVVVDFLDSEILGQLEQDQIEQQAEVAWAAREEITGFAGTYARLGALNLQGVAA